MLGTKVKIAVGLLLALGVAALLEQRAPAAAPMVVAQPAPNNREQQAEKDFKMGEFYRRTGHPGAACFYYEVVCRRYPGTQAAKQAGQRLCEVRKKAELDSQNRPVIVARLDGKIVFEEAVEAMTSASYCRLFNQALDLLCVEYDIVYANRYDGRIEVRERGQ
jgi:hypothetical protein